jgi:6-phosphogluconolactonase (cycloisomerase 2 family)
MAIHRLASLRILAALLLAGAGSALPAESVAAPYLSPIELVPGPYRPAALALSPDARHLYATGFHGNSLHVWERDVATGRLDFVEAISDGMDDTVDGLDGAQGVALNGNGTSLYVAGVRDDAVAAFSRAVPTGALTWLEAEIDGIGAADGLNGASAVRVSNDGQQVYVTGFEEGALAVLARASDGTLAPLQSIATPKYFQASDVETTIGGGTVYVAAIGVRVLSRDLVSGLLTEVDALEMLPYGVFSSDSMVLSPDGRHLYVTDWYTDRVVTLGVDGATGGLAYLGHVDCGAVGGDGYQHASRIAIAPDGARVFVLRSLEQEIAVYLRDPATGALAFEEAHGTGDPGLPDFNVTDVAVSSDVRHVYATVWATPALLGGIQIFAIDASVEFAQQLRNGFGGVQDMNAPTGVVVSPDGRHVYATAGASGSVARFTRAADGALGFVEAVGTGAGSIGGASALAIDPSGTRLVVTGQIV